MMHRVISNTIMEVNNKGNFGIILSNIETLAAGNQYIDDWKEKSFGGATMLIWNKGVQITSLQNDFKAEWPKSDDSYD